MLHAGRVVSKRTCTGPAVVRLFPGVDPEVCAQSGLLGKGLSADCALVWSDAGVCSHVVAQVGVPFVSLSTHRTLVFGGFGDYLGNRGHRHGNDAVGKFGTAVQVGFEETQLIKLSALVLHVGILQNSTMHIFCGAGIGRKGPTGSDGRIFTETVISAVELFLHEIRSQVVNADVIRGFGLIEAIRRVVIGILKLLSNVMAPLEFPAELRITVEDLLEDGRSQRVGLDGAVIFLQTGRQVIKVRDGKIFLNL